MRCARIGFLLVFALAAPALAQRSPSDDAPACAGPGAFSSRGLPNVLSWACSRDHVVALLGPQSRGVGSRLTHDAPVAWTTDRGRTWHRPSWSYANMPRAMAFDGRSGFGMLVGDAGSVWSTTDDGESFVDHGSGLTTQYVALEVIGRVGIALDDHGELFLLRSDGFERESIGHGGEGALRREPDAIVVRTTEGRLRLRRSGAIEHER